MNVISVPVVVGSVTVVGTSRRVLIARPRTLLAHRVATEVMVSMVVLLVRVLATPAVDVMPEVTAKVGSARDSASLSGCQVRYIVVLRAGIGGSVIVASHPRHFFTFLVYLDRKERLESRFDGNLFSLTGTIF